MKMGWMLKVLSYFLKRVESFVSPHLILVKLTLENLAELNLTRSTLVIQGSE